MIKETSCIINLSYSVLFRPQSVILLLLENTLQKIYSFLDYIMLLFRITHTYERNGFGNVLHSFNYVSATNGSGNERFSYS